MSTDRQAQGKIISQYLQCFGRHCLPRICTSYQSLVFMKSSPALSMNILLNYTLSPQLYQIGGR